MTIRPLTIDDIPKAIELFQKAYEQIEVPDYEEEDFTDELKASFDCSQIYSLEFFGIEKEGRLVSFAALAKSNFYGGSWELRWGTTHPEHQKKGLMGQLIEHRIKLAIERSKDVPGIIQMASRSPSTYIPFGFKPIFTRGPYNQTTYMIKYINQDSAYDTKEKTCQLL